MLEIIVEDGTMPKGANSYASLEICDNWQVLRGGAWNSPSDDKEVENKKKSALIQATDYLNGLKWIGRKAAAGRTMAWPRIEAIDADGYELESDIVPQSVVNACCYLAGLVFSGQDLFPIMESGERIQKEKIGSLETVYFDDENKGDSFTALVGMLGGLAIGLDDTDCDDGKLKVHKLRLA